MLFFKSDEANFGDEAFETSDMKFPYRCLRCYGVHDVANVTVIQRYSDCTLWRCPNCNQAIDDRPQSWGGSAERLY